MRKFLTIVSLASIVALLAGCGGGAAPDLSLAAAAPKIKSKNPDDIEKAGPTMKDSFIANKTFRSGNLTTSSYGPLSGQWNNPNPSATITIRNNYTGGYDLSMDQGLDYLIPAFTTGFTTQNIRANSTDAWSKDIKNAKGAKLYSLSLWNAGKGGRDGLQQDMEGQVYHKIIGYYIYKYDTKDSGGNPQPGNIFRGFAVVGNETSAAALAKRTRKAEYDGYFYRENYSGDLNNPKLQSGGLHLQADFGKHTISGKTTSFATRDPGFDLFTDRAGKSLTFNEATINKDGTYSGSLKDQDGNNQGGYNGRFFGANADETAGVMTEAYHLGGGLPGFFSATRSN